MAEPRVGATTKLRMEAWLTCERPEMTKAEAVAEIEAAGNVILIDEWDESRRFKVADQVLDFAEAANA